MWGTKFWSSYLGCKPEGTSLNSYGRGYKASPNHEQTRLDNTKVAHPFLELYDLVKGEQILLLRQWKAVLTFRNKWVSLLLMLAILSLQKQKGRFSDQVHKIGLKDSKRQKYNQWRYRNMFDTRKLKHRWSSSCYILSNLCSYVTK